MGFISIWDDEWDGLLWNLPHLMEFMRINGDIRLKMVD
jgi:hypothetical protein